MKRLRLIVAKEGGEKCSPSLIGFLGANFLVVWCGAVRCAMVEEKGRMELGGGTM